MDTRFLSGFVILLTLGSSCSQALLSSPSSSPSKAISDMKEAIVKGLGFLTETGDFKISGFDIRDSLVGQSVAYQFDILVGNKVLPFKLVEDVNRWEDIHDLPFLFPKDGEGGALVVERDAHVLPPFQLAGPMELWIQDAKDIRLSLPHDVDAGVLKKVVLADGAIVTVKGARSVSLRQPLDLPLPLNQTINGDGGTSSFASALVNLAQHLRLLASSRNDQGQTTPLVSLRIVGPTSLTSSAANNKLKLKRLAPGLVELSSPPKTANEIQAVELENAEFLEQDQFTTLWPLATLNGSNSNLRGFEKLLYSVLGEKANKEGLFKLLKAEASAHTFVKMVFGVEKELEEEDTTNNVVDWQGFPEWKTKPRSVKMHFEVLARVDGDKVVPEKVVQVPDPVLIEDTVAPNLLMGNLTVSSMPLVYPPSSFFSL